LLVAAALFSTAAQWSTAMFDNFNIEDGEPGKDWKAVNSSGGLPPGGTPQIFNHQLCGTTQSVALFAINGTMQADARITYLFQSSTNAGFETYVVAMKGLNFTGEILLVGCDGGHQGRGFCQPVIRTFETTYATGDPQALSAHTTYRIQIVFSSKSNVVQWTLSNSYGETLYQLLGAVADLKTFTQGGLLVGRQGVTCADDFRLEVQN